MFTSRLHPLAGDLHQSEFADGQDGMFGPVGFHEVIHRVGKLLLLFSACFMSMKSTTIPPGREGASGVLFLPPLQVLFRVRSVPGYC